MGGSLMWNHFLIIIHSTGTYEQILFRILMSRSVSLLHNAPNYVGSWVHYPKEMFLQIGSTEVNPKITSRLRDRKRLSQPFQKHKNKIN